MSSGAARGGGSGEPSESERGLGACRAGLSTGGPLANAGAPLVAESAAPPGEVPRGSEDVRGRDAAVAEAMPFARDLGEEFSEGVRRAGPPAGTEGAAGISDAYSDVRSPLMIGAGSALPPNVPIRSGMHVDRAEGPVLESVPLCGQSWEAGCEAGAGGQPLARAERAPGPHLPPVHHGRPPFVVCRGVALPPHDPPRAVEDIAWAEPPVLGSVPLRGHLGRDDGERVAAAEPPSFAERTAVPDLVGDRAPPDVVGGFGASPPNGPAAVRQDIVGR